MKFSDFVVFLEKIERTSKRLEKTDLVSKLFSLLDEEEIKQVVYFLNGSLGPIYDPKEFNLSEKLLLKVASVFLSKTDIKVQDEDQTQLSLLNTSDDSYEKQTQELYKKFGDIGDLFFYIFENIKLNKKDLDFLDIYKELLNIAQISGDGSVEAKKLALISLFENLEKSQVKFIARFIVKKLRLGLSAMTIIDALSFHTVSDKSLSSHIEEAYQRFADLGTLAKKIIVSFRNLSDKDDKEVVYKHIFDFLKTIDIRLMVPVQVALCQRVKDANEAIEKMGEVFVEPKYDGIRAELHFSKKQNKFAVFTRNLENITYMVPELEKNIQSLNCDDCILDSEAVSFDPDTGEMLPFHKTMQRKRKYQINDFSKKMPITFFVFDILYLNGVSLINKPLYKRKEFLQQVFNSNYQNLKIVETKQTQSPDFINNFYLQKVKQGYEGVVLKKVRALYKSGRKGYRWVKIKELESSKGRLNDTLDVIVMGYSFGKGKRKKLGIGKFLVGVLDRTKIKTIAKLGTGFTEQDLISLKTLCDNIKTLKKPDIYEVDKSLEPDVWLYPSLVFEIGGDEITTSPVHTSGFSVRFPKFIRIRDDKDIYSATTLEEIKKIKVE